VYDHHAPGLYRRVDLYLLRWGRSIVNEQNQDGRIAMLPFQLPQSR
jgi:hypothetical protein